MGHKKGHSSVNKAVSSKVNSLPAHVFLFLSKPNTISST